MTPRIKVLVTGAEEHQGLAVIRGLGHAGIPVVACGAAPRSLGFYSRHAVDTGLYTSPFENPERFLDDLMAIIERTRPTLVVPTVESTLVVLSGAQARERLARHAVLAAPDAETLEYALDKGKTLALAARLNVPAPRTVQGHSAVDLLQRAARLTFPVAVKPRGHGLHLPTANALGFKVRYAADPAELERLLSPFGRDAHAVLVQEFMPGVGRCVSTVCRHGTPLALLAYAREREFPLSGGVSVLRRTIALDDRLVSYVTTLLGAIRWHGVAMVEFKYDRRADAYTLMEINGRFQASTALSLDAGLNLPHLVARLHGGGDLPEVSGYRLGVTERWLRGDLYALRDALRLKGLAAAAPLGRPRSRLRALWQFVRDFRPGIRYDEFRLADWRPGLVEAGALGTLVARWVAEWVAGHARRPRRPRPHAARQLIVRASARTQRSIRA